MFLHIFISSSVHTLLFLLSGKPFNFFFVFPAVFFPRALFLDDILYPNVHCKTLITSLLLNLSAKICLIYSSDINLRRVFHLRRKTRLTFPSKRRTSWTENLRRKTRRLPNLYQDELPVYDEFSVLDRNPSSNINSAIY